MAILLTSSCFFFTSSQWAKMLTSSHGAFWEFSRELEWCFWDRKCLSHRTVRYLLSSERFEAADESLDCLISWTSGRVFTTLEKSENAFLFQHFAFCPHYNAVFVHWKQSFSKLLCQVDSCENGAAFRGRTLWFWYGWTTFENFVKTTQKMKTSFLDSSRLVCEVDYLQKEKIWTLFRV